ncbi:MAG: phage portal protein [Bacteroidaceae bacterium]|nr:phage portal protein [Bacteroidaceae bacterium]
MISPQEKQYIEFELTQWLMSDKRNKQIEGVKYYNGRHDILDKTRQMKDPDGKMMDMSNLPNNKIVTNLVCLAVDQKSNYLFAKPLSITAENKTYRKRLDAIFNPKFMRSFKSLGKGAISSGLGWLYPYMDDGELKFKRLPATEVLPFWKDADHTELNYAVRYYTVQEPMSVTTTEKVEIFTEEGIEYYIWNGHLIPDDKPAESYNTIIYTDQYQKRVELGASWGRVPLIPFKANSDETPLLSRVKSLQDAINSIMSAHQDNLMEDMRSTILVIQNYVGTDLAEFRHNLAAAGAIKVSTVDGVKGGVDPLRIEVDSNNYEVVLRELKRAFFNNARCFDPTDELMNSRPNEMNLKSLYMIIDLDSNEMEAEFRASFEDLMWFVNKYIMFTHGEDYSDETVDIRFNRDKVIDEASHIEQFVMSKGLIPDRIAFENHPWIKDVEEALELQKEQDAEAQADALMGLGRGGAVDGRFNTAKSTQQNGGVNGGQKA